MPRRVATSLSKTGSQVQILLQNLDHDVLVLKGSEGDAASALLNGAVSLTVTEPISVKKISVRLYCTMRLKHSPGSLKASNFEKKLYEHNWDNIEFEHYLNNLYDNTATAQPQSPPNGPSTVGSPTRPSTLQKTHSSASLKGLTLAFKSKSSSNLMNTLHMSHPHQNSSSTTLGATAVSTPGGSKSSHFLVQGNYMFPFSAILPGSMPESVEGLPGASVVYKIEAIIDRGKFLKHLISKKHLRVIRTLTTDAVELSETVAVDNTWPKKVEYSLNVPAKAIAIGGGTSVSFMLVPLLKGLLLGDISIQLVEMYSYMGIYPPPVNGERIVCEKKIRRPKEDDTTFMKDTWEIESFLKVPASLSKCTQDCDIGPHLRVRHKLKFVIGLVNPDNHVSELRASLPVQLFISPFLTVTAKYEDDYLTVDVRHQSNEEEETIFTRDSHNHSGVSLNHLAVETEDAAPHTSSSHTSLNGFVAPPLYEKHIYDRLWNDISPVETPLASGYVSPQRSLLTEQLGGIDGALLRENLRQLSIQRQQQENTLTSEVMNASGHSSNSTNTANNSLPRDRGIFSFDDDQPSNSLPVPDYFNSRPRSGISASLNHNLSHLLSSGLATPPVHLSRANSDTDVATMNQVPTYDEALLSDTNEDALSPAYEPPLPGSNINVEEMNKRFEQLCSTSGPTGTHGMSVVRNLRSGKSSPSLSRMSRSASQNSSPSVSRQQSLINLVTSSKSNSNSNSRSSTNIAFLNEPQTQAVVNRTIGSATFTMAGHPDIHSGGSSGSHSHSNSAINLTSGNIGSAPTHIDVPPHILATSPTAGGGPGTPVMISMPEAHVHSNIHSGPGSGSGSSSNVALATTKLSLSASERKPLSRSDSSKSLHSLHNLSFLSKRKK